MNFEASSELDPDCQLFRGDPKNKSLSLIDRLWIPAGAAFLGSVSALLANFYYRRPVSSGLHRYLIRGVVGGLLGEGAHRAKVRTLAEKDLQYYHYMTLHPEDFQAPIRVKYKDYLTFWVPVR